MLSSLCFPLDFDEDFVAAAKHLWNTTVPSKSSAFGWLLFQD